MRKCEFPPKNMHNSSKPIVPTSIEWWMQDAVRWVEDQPTCESCWAFSAVCTEIPCLF